MACRGIDILYYRKRDTSSAKNLAFVDRLSDRSLMQIKNNSGPSMEPWGTPALILTREISDNIQDLI